MNKAYALIKKGIVTNAILWEGPNVTPVDFGKGVTYAEIPDGNGNTPSEGWLYDGAIFSQPPLSDEEKAAKEAVAVNSNISLKQSLMEEATLRRDTLQDAVDEGLATDDEVANLSLWKKYRVLLARVDANTAHDIEWPSLPNS